MRRFGVHQTFLFDWPISTQLDYPDLTGNLSWSPWGVFKTKNIHCYTDDYRFEGCWSNPQNALQRVLNLNFVISPDFSVYKNAPSIVNRWQLYRSLAVFSFWQNMGVRVIPSINWVSPSQIISDKDLYPNFNIISVRCPGFGYYDEWVSGVELIKSIIRPKIVLHFGAKRGLESWNGLRVLHYKLRGK